MVSQLPVAIIILSVVAAVAALAAIVVAFVILLKRSQLSTQLEHSTSVVRPISSSMPEANKKSMASTAITDLDNMEQGRSHVAAGTTTYKRSISKSNGVQTGMKLTFLREDRPKFNLSDLLRASAEILGSGIFGSSYKADLEDGSSRGGKLPSSAVVVKRYRKMNNVGREDFQEHMRRLGKFRHPNLLPLVAYYYRKEEKLLVSDYVANGSLAFHLHGT